MKGSDEDIDCSGEWRVCDVVCMQRGGFCNCCLELVLYWILGCLIRGNLLWEGRGYVVLWELDLMVVSCVLCNYLV